MTAFAVERAAQAQAEAIAGAEFGVQLGADGLWTHVGCNWVNCPEEIVQKLAAIAGIRVGADFWELCDGLGISPIDLSA